MNKTPEEILRETHERLSKDNPKDWKTFEQIMSDDDGTGTAMLSAMQEYADQEKRKAFNEALDLGYAFANWIQDKQYFRYWGSDGPNCGKWYKGYTMPDRSYYTTEELFKIFERENTKNK